MQREAKCSLQQEGDWSRCEDEGRAMTWRPHRSRYVRTQRATTHTALPTRTPTTGRAFRSWVGKLQVRRRATLCHRSHSQHVSVQQSIMDGMLLLGKEEDTYG